MCVHAANCCCHASVGCHADAPHIGLGHTPLTKLPFSDSMVATGSTVPCALCNVLHLPWACFIRCCTKSAEFPLNIMHAPCKWFSPYHQESPAFSDGTFQRVCVEPRLVFAWSICKPMFLKPSLRSRIICSSASCDVAKTTTLSAYATLGKYHYFSVLSVLCTPEM